MDDIFLPPKNARLPDEIAWPKPQGQCIIEGMNPTQKHIQPFVDHVKQGASLALLRVDPAIADDSMAAVASSMRLLEIELSKARALQMVIRLEQAFLSRPDVDAIMCWARGLDFGVALGANEASGFTLISEHDRDLDPRAVEHYARDPDWAGQEPEYEPEDFIDGPFHKAFEVFLGRDRNSPSPLIDLPWLYEEGTGWIPRSDALGLAESLGMPWMRSWVESAEIDAVANPSTRSARPSPHL